MSVRASNIDFSNSREIYTHLKTLETENFNGSPSSVSVTQVGRATKVSFTYVGEDLEIAKRKMNSFFLDRGFKSFFISTDQNSGGIVVLSVLFKTKKV